MNYMGWLCPFAAALVVGVIAAVGVSIGRPHGVLEEDKDTVLVAAISTFYAVLVVRGPF